MAAQGAQLQHGRERLVGIAINCATNLSIVPRSSAATAEAFAAGDAILSAPEKIALGNPTAAIDRLSTATARLTAASLRLDDLRPRLTPADARH